MALALAAAAVANPASARTPSTLVGHYRADEGPDVAGDLLIASDSRFAYSLAAGALDEQAQGTWRQDGAKVCLTTAPKPVPPVFRRLADAGDPALSPTVFVTWPNGQGIAGVDFRIGFATGEPVTGYTQEDGWSLPADETRTPLWVELAEPIHGITSPRFDLTAKTGGKLHVELVPNDLGVVDFDKACLEKIASNKFVLHRREGDMRFVSAKD